ncbi:MULTISPECIES: N-6 DNA methylase [Pseudomonas syringae group]|uniref:N-6 DNA methylase n=1 Tax=Pseudomonas syringae group TaxID=136849 RepID=UPI000E31F8FC|nr:MULTISPECIES: N-6 DNA methylase [Pseudomonas syringae group]
MPSTKESLATMSSIISSVGYYPARRVFADFVEMAAIAIRNSCDQSARDVREARYLTLIGKYKPQDQPKFGELLQHLVQALDLQAGDLLGELYMSLGVSNADMGQFFTPPSISTVLSKLAMDSDHIQAQVKRRGFVTLSEPASGSGAMVIGFANSMFELGINYQQHLHATLIDLDIRAVHMAFIQLSLLHIPAVVVHGNTLTLAEYSHWHTPSHAMNLFDYKLKRGFSLDSEMGIAYLKEDSATQLSEFTCGVLAHTAVGNNFVQASNL